jgi:hypothetical protein
MIDTYLLLTLASALLLSMVHVWATYLHPGKFIARQYWLSFADGVSITYILLRLFTEISQASEHLPQPVAKEYQWRIPEAVEPIVLWTEHYPFFPLLVSFTLFYGLEKLVARPQHKLAAEGEGLSPLRIWIHIAGFSLYKVVIGYLLAQMTGLSTVIVFTIAMAMHFLVIDLHLIEIHRGAYLQIGRWIFTVSFLIGWRIGSTAVISTSLVAILMSFVSGGAVLMIIQEEFSEDHPSSYLAFLLGVVLYSGLLLML